jgi:hypothetical protein
VIKKFIYLLLFVLLNVTDSSGQGALLRRVIVGAPAAAPSNGYLTETNNYLNSDAALSGLSTPEKDVIDRLFRDFQGYSNGSYTTYNKWGNMKGVYLILGGTTTSTAINGKSPGTYNLTHVSSPTINATPSSISYDGTTDYSSSGFTPSNSNDTSDLSFFIVHRRDANEDLSSTVGIAFGGNTYGIIRSDNFRNFFCFSQSAGTVSGAGGVNAFWATSFSGSTTMNVYRNGTNIKSIAGSTIGSAGSRPFYIGAGSGNAAPIFGGPCTYDIVIFGTGYWSNAEQTFLYNALNAFQTGMSR